MIDDKLLTPPGFDQDLAKLRDMLPAVWWAIYSGCIDKGFSKEQALLLVIAYIGKGP